MDENQPIEPKVNEPDAPVEPKVIPEAEDLTSLFTADDIKAKKETIAKTKAEDDRRSKLTKEALEVEDKAKAAEAKKADEAAAKDKAPEQYAEFKIPAGMEMDKETLTEAAPLFKELGLSQDKAQKIVDLYSTKIAPAFLKRATDAWEKQKSDWYNETVADKEIKLDDKGANLDGHRVINSLFNPEEAKKFKSELVKFGLDNHPQLNKLLTRMSKHLKEDTIELGRASTKSQPAKTVDDVANRLYPDKK